MFFDIAVRQNIIVVFYDIIYDICYKDIRDLAMKDYGQEH